MSKFIPYHNYRIHYLDEGQGEPVLLLHGWPTNARLWRAQIDALTPDYRVVAPDWLGFGESDKPTDFTYTFSQQKEILSTLIDALFAEGERIHLVAHDIGGPPAILWTSENEARVARLVLLNTILYPFKTPLDRFSHGLFQVPLIRNIVMSQFGLRSIMRQNTRAANRRVDPLIRDILSVYRPDDFSVKLKTILEPMDAGHKDELKTLSARYRAIKAKKALIIAEHDPLCYAHIQRLSEENPGVPVYPIPDCGHYLPIDRPAEVSEALRKILAG